MVDQITDEPRELTLVREEVRTWLEENWDPERPVREWREMLLQTGWGVPTFPGGRFGRGASSDVARVVSQEFARVKAVGVAGGMARSLASPSIVEHGSDEQVERLVRPALLGDQRWCQLFSEPGAGSDLAGVTTTAVLHGDEFIVNGQKVWTSGAIGTDMGMLVCRTDWDVPKHQGISWIGFPMKQEGVDMRPLKQMTGGAGFNEVFLTDCRAPRDNAVGGINGGWKVATTTLAHERSGEVQIGVPAPGELGGRPAAGQGESHEGEERQRREQIRARGFGPPNAIKLAKELGKNTDPNMRQIVVKHWMLNEVARLNGERARAARKAGKRVGPEGSLTKLSRSDITRSTREVSMALLGAGGMLAGSEAPYNGSVAMQCLSSPGPSIFGGTDQIQKNILGERVLGLPREPSVDVDIPFREVKTNVRKS